MINDGLYLGVLDNCGLDTSSKGTFCLDIIFNIDQTVDAEMNWVAIPVLHRHIRIYLSDAAWEMSKQKLALLQFNGDFTAPDITHEYVQLKMHYEDYKGQPQEKWELANIGLRDRIEPGSDEVRKLTTRWKTDQQMNQKPTGKPRNRKLAVPVTSDGEESIPF